MAHATIDGPAGQAAAEDRTNGGPVGNERLTSIVAAALFVLLALEGATVPFTSDLIAAHIFLGIVLIPPVLLKLGSTGYRMLRYYAGSRPYVRRGPPPTFLRALGPIVVLSTGVLLGSGVALLFAGPGGGGAVRGLHKLGFIVFFGSTALHVLAHIRKVPTDVAAEARPASRVPGAGRRGALLLAALVVGLGLGAASLAADGSWVHRPDRGAFGGDG